jgi:putative drug exporter of the RND superfamily
MTPSDGPIAGSREGFVGSSLAGLGSFCWRWPKSVVLAWVAAVLVAGLAAFGLDQRLLSGSGNIAGSASLRVDESLRSDFEHQGGQSLILTFRSRGLERRPAELSNLVDRLQRTLVERDSVAAATADRDMSDRRLRPEPRTGHFIIVDLETEDLLATEQEVPRLRAAIAPVMEEARSRHPELEWAITGPAALNQDLNRFSNDDAARSEIRALPLTLVILVLAFGALVAAMVPLLLALATRTVALGIIVLLAGPIEISNLVQSLVTMLAIALGIDYSLFLIHRYRQERARAAPPDQGIAGEELAMRAAMAQSGAAILYSGATVAIGMGALLATPMMQMQSIGLGGMIVVLVSLLASLTLAPAFLRLLGPRRLEWPAWLSGRLDGARSRRFWERWARLVMRHPVAAIVVSLVVLLSLAAPAVQTRFGLPESEVLPAELEFSRGVEMLDGMQLKGLVSPVMVVVRDVAGGEAWTPERVPALARFVARLEQDRRVRIVLGPVQSSAAAGPPDRAASLEEAFARAVARESFISRDRSLLLFRIVPAGDSTLAGLRNLARHIPGWLAVDGLRAEVGGQAQYYRDFNVAVKASYPMTIGLVLGMSALALLLFFRAPLASAKAIFLNLLSVAAGYGVVVLVFQLGYGAALFGVAEPMEIVPTVPLVIFCILFGLSMDYEIFLLSRVRTIFAATGDNERSVREALADTGSVITSAALIMVAVFGAFAFARDVIVQMIGLGLAVAVFVDATLIRSVLGPALMQVAGRWNWWPGQLRSVR